MAQRKSKKPAPKTGRDRTTVTIHGNQNAVATSGGIAIVTNNERFDTRVFESWRKHMENEVDRLQDFPEEDKASLKQSIDQIAREAEKGRTASENRLERLLNSVAAMAPDIFDVAVATLANPLAGISLIIKKVGDKAKVIQKA